MLKFFKISCQVCFIFLFLISASFAFELEVWSDKDTVPVSQSVKFNCVPKGGVAPYKYSWNFDDIDTYKDGESKTPYPSHTFDYLGLHKVWVTVKDSAGNQEKALLLIDVKISSAENRVNVTDPGDVGSGNVLYNDGSHAYDNSRRIANIISSYYDSSDGLTLYFPSGTYKFQDYGQWNSSPDKRYAIKLPSKSDIIFEGERKKRPTLEFYNTKTHDGASRDAMIYRNKTAGHLLLRTIIFKWNGSKDISSYDAQQLLAEPDDPNVGLYITIEDSDIEDFSNSVGLARFILRRCNISGFGRFYGWGTNQGFTQAIDAGDHSLMRHNYVAVGNADCYNTSEGLRCGHSKLWYFQNFQYAYIIENFGDATNAEESQDFIVMKQGSKDAIIKGNLFRNSKSTFIQLGKYNSPADNILVEDNRLIRSDTNSTMLVYSSISDIIFNDNFTVDNAGGFLKVGDKSKCLSGSDANGITYSNNVGGWDDPVPTASSGYSVCGSGPSWSIKVGGGNISNNSRIKAGDPAGWYDANGYLDPGEFEYSPPVNTSVAVKGAGSNVTLTLSATDNGSGMGTSARFPYTNGALVQLSNDGKTWSEVRPFSQTTSWKLSNTTNVYARFRDRNGNWSQPVETDSPSGEEEPLPPHNLRIISED